MILVGTQTRCPRNFRYDPESDSRRWCTTGRHRLMIVASSVWSLYHGQVEGATGLKLR
jgi:hypothetical protein